MAESGNGNRVSRKRGKGKKEAPEAAEPGSVPVTIYGRTYHLRGGDEKRLQRLAGLVDRRMREISSATGTADSVKVAILASLNLADDYLTARREESPSVDGDTEARLAEMVTLLDEALAG